MIFVLIGAIGFAVVSFREKNYGVAVLCALLAVGILYFKYGTSNDGDSFNFDCPAGNRLLC